MWGGGAKRLAGPRCRGLTLRMGACGGRKVLVWVLVG